MEIDKTASNMHPTDAQADQHTKFNIVQCPEATQIDHGTRFTTMHDKVCGHSMAIYIEQNSDLLRNCQSRSGCPELHT